MPVEVGGSLRAFWLVLITLMVCLGVQTWFSGWVLNRALVRVGVRRSVGWLEKEAG